MPDGHMLMITSILKDSGKSTVLNIMEDRASKLEGKANIRRVYVLEVLRDSDTNPGYELRTLSHDMSTSSTDRQTGRRWGGGGILRHRQGQ